MRSRSAIRITPDGPGDEVLSRFTFLLDEAWRLSKETGKSCELFLQHNMASDRVVVLVEMVGRNFGVVRKTFVQAAKACADEITKYRRQRAKEQADERAPRKTGSRRRRWKAAAR